jgi:hypothetical protein
MGIGTARTTPHGLKHLIFTLQAANNGGRLRRTEPGHRLLLSPADKRLRPFRLEGVQPRLVSILANESITDDPRRSYLAPTFGGPATASPSLLQQRLGCGCARAIKSPSLSDQAGASSTGFAGSRRATRRSRSRLPRRLSCRASRSTAALVSPPGPSWVQSRPKRLEPDCKTSSLPCPGAH